MQQYQRPLNQARNVQTGTSLSNLPEHLAAETPLISSGRSVGFDREALLRDAGPMALAAGAALFSHAQCRPDITLGHRLGVEHY
jgi:hypothetical protein